MQSTTMTIDEFNKYINELIASGASMRDIGENCEVSFTVLNGDWEDDVFITFPKTLKKSEITVIPDYGKYRKSAD